MALEKRRRMHRPPGRDARPEGQLQIRAREIAMKVVRISDAQPYVAPKHFDMRSLRLQGAEASDAKSFWVGLSHFLPGGGAERDTTPIEKVYVVIDGEVTVVTDTGEAALGPLD